MENICYGKVNLSRTNSLCQILNIRSVNILSSTHHKLSTQLFKIIKCLNGKNGHIARIFVCITHGQHITKIQHHSINEILSK